jgi:glycosyltransferase involved in cell wall biosynthesis
MSSILFWDPSCQRPYDTRTIRQEATGGTEASLSRVADALDAYVIQHNRVDAEGRYFPPGRIPGITDVVLNRDSRALPIVRELYPDARYYLWLHDQISPDLKRGRRLASTVDLLSAMSVTIICVSHWQSLGVKAMLAGMGVQDRVQVQTIYNPIDDNLIPDGSSIDCDKLVFFSSQNRGLKFAIDAFGAMRRQMPELRLVIGNPGYKIRKSATIAGVTNLGPQPQARIHAEVRTALCTFCPNFVLPETFGLVFAESMALGTPVLTHDCGAASEVIADPAQVLPVLPWQRAYEGALGNVSSHLRRGPARIAAGFGLFDPYIERIRAWRSGARPRTGPDPRFQLAMVATQWRALLGSSGR